MNVNRNNVGQNADGPARRPIAADTPEMCPDRLCTWSSAFYASHVGGSVAPTRRSALLHQSGMVALVEAGAEWIEAHRTLFEARFEAVAEIISDMKKEEGDESAS